MTKLPLKLKKNTILELNKEKSWFSFQYDPVKTRLDSYEDEFSEPEVIEVPIVKRMVFQFKKPVKLEFS